LVQLFDAARRQRDPGAGLGKKLGETPAESAGGAGDERGFAGEANRMFTVPLSVCGGKRRSEMNM